MHMHTQPILYTLFARIWDALITMVGGRLALTANFPIPITVLGGSPHGIIARIMNCSLEISEFKLQSCHYIHF